MTQQPHDNQELIMNLTQAYEEARAIAVQEGVQQGQHCDLNDNLAKRSRNTSHCTRTTYSSKL
ncbi:hypothetical protein NIES4074_62640 (plasmid) [Cylindrospermum sp. NIES-4074]|nr:hypothetical protein NIES4074_62640 [Cylindrospermum sp. NIES-4074]